jgi:hypothetical protein
MKKRLSILLGLLVGAMLVVGLAWPRTHFAMLGWLRGEAYFAGQPTSYWTAALRKEPFAGESGDICKKLEEGGAAAIPVLSQMLRHEDDYIRQQARLTLGMMNWGDVPFTPAAVRILAETAPELFPKAAQHVGRRPSSARATTRARAKGARQ